jgi:hypothetical protein
LITNSFSGNWRNRLFISKTNRATLIVELGRSLLRMISSIGDSSPVISLLVDDAEIG